MATPRKHYFRVAESLIREDATPEQVGILVLLMAHMNGRAIRDGLSAEQACTVVLRGADLYRITGRKLFKPALTSLQGALKVASTSVSPGDGVVSIYWPKFAEFQGLTTRARPEHGSSASASASASASSLKLPSPPNHHPASGEEEKKTRSPLLNFLGKLPGSDAEKQLWLADEEPVIDADVAAGKGTLQQLVTRYYRHYVKGDRPFQREAEREEARRKVREANANEPTLFEVEAC